jgi:hypothetical protein
MYEFFQKLKCTVIKYDSEIRRYEVSIPGPALKATLVCKYPLKEGDEVLGIVGDYKDGHCLLAICSSECLRLIELNKHR